MGFALPIPAFGQLPADAAELTQRINRVPEGRHQDWNWGGLEFNWAYRFYIKVKNECVTQEQVMVLPDANLAPLIRVEPVHAIPPESTKRIWSTVITGPPGDFVSEWQLITLPNGAVFPLGWSYVEIEGQLFVSDLIPGPECLGDPKVYDAYGRLFNIPGDDPVLSDCWTYWRQSLRPPATWDCTEAYRGFAMGFLASLGTQEELAESSEWGWLPTPEEVMQMSDIELLEMKKKAEAQRLDTLSSGG